MTLIEKGWYQGHPIKWVLLPLSLLFWLLSSLRRIGYKLGLFNQPQVPLPVVIVGNIGIGGNGKTPLVVFLVEQLKNKGFNPGVISRGYGSNAPHYPYLVEPNADAAVVGDEPSLIASRTNVPVVISPDRIASVNKLKQLGCDIVLSDDGLQHYRLPRLIELVVVDGKRRFGNGFLLPAGPLRETQARLKTVDAVIINGGEKLAQSDLAMTLSPNKIVNLATGAEVTVDQFVQSNKCVNALAGIGDPSRFFTTLAECGFTVEKKEGFIDHHAYCEDDLRHFSTDMPLLMTEKDAVKCRAFAHSNYWYLTVDSSFAEDETQELIELITTRCKHYGV